ncbi:large subunit ribosomal protein L7Ae [Paragonimus westermani]|uniref:60S ribosomal protein L7a n=1 Tax=Paragonimus westermani TaxID=34504 RepID=A0A5J4NQG4_9TREM|nr:large subunit ribosomal protein L7Ae [Paragonimus westermani]
MSDKASCVSTGAFPAVAACGALTLLDALRLHLHVSGFGSLWVASRGTSVISDRVRLSRRRELVQINGPLEELSRGYWSVLRPVNKPKKVIRAKKIKEVALEEPTVAQLKKGKLSKVAALPDFAKKSAAKKKVVRNPLIQRRPRNFGIGQAIQPKRDLYRFVKWPKYVELQRKRAVLKKRLKVPPPIHQFSQTLDRSSCSQLFNLAEKYQPLSKRAKKMMLLHRAQVRAEGKPDDPATRKPTLRAGKRAVVLRLQMSESTFNPHSISGSFREDRSRMTKLVETVKNNYTLRFEEIRKHWGGGILGAKSQARIAKLEKLKAKELQIKLS